jgi:hypothetical protein
MSFIDDAAFPDDASVRQERVAPYVIRTEKRGAITTEGAPLFKPREVRLLPVEWDPEHAEQSAPLQARRR